MGVSTDSYQPVALNSHKELKELKNGAAAGENSKEAGVKLKAEMTLLNGCGVIIGCIIGLGRLTCGCSTFFSHTGWLNIEGG